MAQNARILTLLLLTSAFTVNLAFTNVPALALSRPDGLALVRHLSSGCCMGKAHAAGANSATVPIRADRAAVDDPQPYGQVRCVRVATAQKGFTRRCRSTLLDVCTSSSNSTPAAYVVC